MTVTAVLEPTARRGFPSIPAQPWIPGQYGAGAIPVIGAPDAPAATPTRARAVSGLPGLLKAALDVLVALLLLVLLFPVLLTLALARPRRRWSRVLPADPRRPGRA